MRLASLASAACAVLVLALAPNAAAQSGLTQLRSGWYVSGAVGANWGSEVEQTGLNRDPLCYPTNACFDEEPRPEFPGYRWAYDLDSGSGAMFELSAGYTLRRVRFELSFGERRNGVEQMFRSATTLDGAVLEDRRNSTVRSDTTSSIDALTVRTLAFNGYYDFWDAAPGFTPYIGAGVGPAFVGIRGVRFSDEYFDTADGTVAYDPPLSSYNARLDDDYTDTVLAGHLHAGADFGVKERTALGFRLTYSMLSDAQYTGTYSLHAAHRFDPDFTHTDRFAGTRYWSLQFTVRYVLGD
ncbi:MAG: P44/Msp2 family outer membrane protein [Acidobacteriia bacterium]|nr:P44/Msp2 family outer membrane protein [Terriglobia bacterium]MYG01552.1 P44/Msp2 family outer membrane protein [Terriglobia bacterium]MYK10359.1 P44/Msp2 family outer membrane protein [Terriglobia bacterium]